jgi:iron-sulfur cluster repair protein YtfE (RIC family)
MKLDHDLIHTHRHCQQLFTTLRDIVAQQAWAQAQQACHDFCAAMDSHFADEEQLLYPLYEQATGQQQGPTEVMRYEHEQMRELMETLFQAVLQHDVATFARQAQVLQLQLHQHNLKEENILYPYCQLDGADSVALRWRPLPGG